MKLSFISSGEDRSGKILAIVSFISPKHTYFGLKVNKTLYIYNEELSLNNYLQHRLEATRNMLRQNMLALCGLKLSDSRAVRAL